MAKSRCCASRDKPQRCALVTPALTSMSRDFALVIDGTPQVHPPAGDPHHHLVEVPSVARTRPALPQPSRDPRTELQHPSPHRFVGDVEPSFGQELLDIAIAQSEPEIEPDRAG
jgi:hypothetical protein